MHYGLIGEHLPHSFSKIIHEKLADYTYDLHELRPDEVDAFMRAADFKGINVTIPYKQTVIPYLDEISDQARQIGAVNTIVNRGGKLYGYNTDYFGMRDLIQHNGAPISGKKVLILGTGGTSKTATAVATDLGASEILKVSRSGKDGAITYEEAYEKHSDAEFVINCTPCGMFPKINASPLDIARFPNLVGVIDAIYNPLRDKLILDAQKRGIAAEGGLYMLVVQAVYACEMFIDTKIAPAKSERVYRDLLNSKRNIVLTGMDEEKKSNFGTILANAFGRKLIKATSADVEKLATENGLVIVTTGDLTESNIDNLMMNGFVVSLDNKTSDFFPDATIPPDISTEEITETVVELMNKK